MKYKVTADPRNEWGQYGPRIYLDGELFGEIDTSSALERAPEFCDLDASECSSMYLDGEGDVNVVNGWHEFWDCEPEFGACPVADRWVEELEEALEDPEAFAGDIFDDSANLAEAAEWLDGYVSDEWGFSFSTVGR